MLYLNSTQIYAFAAGGLFLLLMLYRLITKIYYFIHNQTAVFFLQHFVYPLVFRRGLFLGPKTRYHLILQLMYCAGTAICNSVGVGSLTAAGSRAGTLSAINLIPLFFGNHLSFAADLIGISLRSFRAVHSCIGLMAFVLGLFHAVIATIRNPGMNLRDQLWWCGLAVSVPDAITM